MPEARVAPPGADAAAAANRRTVRLVLAGLMLGMLLAMLDNLIVSTALPTIVGDLGGLSELSWVVTAYTLGAAVTTPFWGKLGDLYGRKIMFMAAIAVFLAGSALAGLSANMDQLIGFRAVQGLGSGGLMVGAIAILGDLVPPRERGRYMGFIGAMMPIAFVGGPLLGGFLTQHLSWRYCFYVNLPLGAAALAVCGLGMRLPHRRVRARIDWTGGALLTVGVVAVTLLASWGGVSYGWLSARILGLAALGLVALAAFVAVERRAAEPILPPRMFTSRNFVLSQVLSFLVGGVMFGAVNFLPQYMQYVRGASPTASGLLLLPLMFGMLAVMLAVGQITARTGRYKAFVVVGGGVMTVGMLLLLLLGTGTPTAAASALTLAAGVGMGFLMQNTMLITQNSVAGRDMGAASGAVTLFRTLGGSLGIAVLGSVYAQLLDHRLTARLGPRGHALVGAHIPPSALGRLSPVLRAPFLDAVTHGVHGVFVGGALLSLPVLLLAWWIREVPLRGGLGPVDSLDL